MSTPARSRDPRASRRAVRYHPRSRHPEAHASGRAPWLRAAVLGANDGLLSTASLLVGVASADADRTVLIAAGVASLVAGAASMGIGEYSSVSAQRDAEAADLLVEAEELRTLPKAELAELTHIYERRGLDHDLAREVAVALTDHDALEAHARDELGLDPDDLARPLQASVTSTISFSIGALVPILVLLFVGAGARIPALVASALIGLAALGAVGARLGGAEPVRGALRVLVGGAAAMTVTWAIGGLFNVNV